MRKYLDQRSHGGRRRVLIAVMAVMAPLAALGVASPAMAQYEKFAQCPATTPGVKVCFYGEITGGEFAIGKTKVPINKTIIQQGGGLPTGATSTYYLLPAKNGESLSKVALNVPGGLLDLINCEEITGKGFFETAAREACKAIFENETTGVTATTELAATEHNPAIINTQNLGEESGVALTLPIKVHLKNPFLGNSCYIGSEAHPIQLHLTTGTTSPPLPNKPISGKAGFFEEEAGEVVVLRENSMVDNAFSVPVAEGCGEFLFITGFLDSIVDKKLGLESAAGKNTAIFNGVQRLVAAAAVAKG